MANENKEIKNNYEDVVVVLSPESIKEAFKKVKKDINAIRSEIVDIKANQVNQAEVMRAILEKFDEINKLKNEIVTIKALMTKLEDVDKKIAKIENLSNKNNIEKLIMNLHKKLEFLNERVINLENENYKLKEENHLLKKDLVRLTNMMKGIIEKNEALY